jgi:hypothetical protein
MKTKQVPGLFHEQFWWDMQQELWDEEMWE